MCAVPLLVFGSVLPFIMHVFEQKQLQLSDFIGTKTHSQLGQDELMDGGEDDPLLWQQNQQTAEWGGPLMQLQVCVCVRACVVVCVRACCFMQTKSLPS